MQGSGSLQEQWYSPQGPFSRGSSMLEVRRGQQAACPLLLHPRYSQSHCVTVLPAPRMTHVSLMVYGGLFQRLLRMPHLGLTLYAAKQYCRSPMFEQHMGYVQQALSYSTLLASRLMTPCSIVLQLKSPSKLTRLGHHLLLFLVLAS